MNDTKDTVLEVQDAVFDGNIEELLDTDTKIKTAILLVNEAIKLLKEIKKEIKEE